jgi:thioredoxin-related protein
MSARLTCIVATFLLSIGLLAGCGGSASGPKDWDDHTQGLPFEVGYNQGMKAAAAQHKPAMMFVTTTWCGWCKKLADENFNDAEVKELLTHFVCVIVDGDEETTAAQKLGADGYPHIVFLSAKGEKLGEFSGYGTIAEFKPVVQKALAKANAKS